MGDVYDLLSNEGLPVTHYSFIECNHELPGDNYTEYDENVTCWYCRVILDEEEDTQESF